MPSETLCSDDCLGLAGSMLHLDPLPAHPTSPVESEGYSTETSSTTSLQNRGPSPAASNIGLTCLGSSMCDQPMGLGSPSPSPLITTSSDASGVFSDPSQWSLFQVSGTPYQSGLDKMLSTSPDIRIDVGKSYTGTICM